MHNFSISDAIRYNDRRLLEELLHKNKHTLDQPRIEQLIDYCKNLQKYTLISTLELFNDTKKTCLGSF
jgi:hypothetical protein